MSEQPDDRSTEPEGRETGGAPATDEDAAPTTQEFGHDGPEHYPPEDDPN